MADRKIFVNLDFGGLQLKNVRIDVMATDPLPLPPAGRIWFNSASGDLKYSDGAAARVLLSGGTLDVGSFDAGAVSTDLAVSAGADQFATASAIKTYADALIGANDAMIFVGGFDAAAAGAFPAGNAGDTYKVTTAGTVNGIILGPGDLLICTADSTPSGTPANWVIVENNLDAATTEIAGYIELATQAEVEARSDSVRAVTPNGLANFALKSETSGTYSAAISSSSGGTISAATHGLGATDALLVDVYESGVKVGVAISVAANGDVTWASNQAIVSGKIVITG